MEFPKIIVHVAMIKKALEILMKAKSFCRSIILPTEKEIQIAEDIKLEGKKYHSLNLLFGLWLPIPQIDDEDFFW